jgi:lysophospholipase L1-like esterase
MFPLLLIQGLWARYRTIRLPDAGGLAHVHHDTGLSILGMGESTIAGVGVSELDQALTARVAESLAEHSGQPVSWDAFGCNGDRLKDLLEKQQALPARQFDAVIVAVGVNDVTGLTSLLRWSQQILELTIKLKELYAAPVCFCSVPPMHLFRALPQPLRYALGVRARMLDHVLRRTAEVSPGVTYLESGFRPDEQYLARDGYHPSEKGYRVWGELIGEQLFALLKDSGQWK